VGLVLFGFVGFCSVGLSFVLLGGALQELGVVRLGFGVARLCCLAGTGTER
jgi:hypothetical protein